MAKAFDIRAEGGIQIIDLLAAPDRLGVFNLKSHLTDLVLKENRRKLVINFQNIKNFNRVDIFALVNIRHLARRQRGDVSLCCLKPSIRKAFDLSGVSKVLDIYDTEQEALAAFQNGLKITKKRCAPISE